MAVFTFRKPGAALSAETATVQYLSIAPLANRAIRIQEFSHSGLGTASAANELWVAPGAAGTGALTGIAAFPINPMSTAASGFTAGTTYATAIPVVNAQAGVAYGVNSNGGTYRWLAKTNFELFSQAAVAGYASMNWKVVSGTGTVAGHMIIEEL